MQRPFETTVRHARMANSKGSCDQKTCRSQPCLLSLPCCTHGFDCFTKLLTSVLIRKVPPTLRAGLQLTKVPDVECANFECSYNAVTCSTVELADTLLNDATIRSLSMTRTRQQHSRARLQSRNQLRELQLDSFQQQLLILNYSSQTGMNICC